MRIALTYIGSGTFSGIPLGLVFLASYVNSRLPEHQVRIVDANWCDPYSALVQGDYDLIGISSMTSQYERATKLARNLRNAATRAPIVLGGVHISTLPSSLRSPFDLGVIGEGEETFCDLIKHFAEGNTDPDAFATVPGLVYQWYSWGQTPPRPVITDMDGFPDLDWSLLDPRYWRRQPNRVWQEQAAESLLVTSRGCPYRCVFCSTTQFWARYRAHSVPWVIRQIQNLTELGVTHVQLYDDLFTVHKKRTREVAEAFRAAGLHKKVKAVSCMARTNLADEELCDILKSMNVKILSFGFESGNDRVLRYLKRDTTSVALNQKAIETCRKHGLRVVGSLMMGSPTETLKEMLDTVRFIRWCVRHGVEDLWPWTSAPYPGTEFWRIGKQRGVVADDMDFDQCAMNSKNPGRPLLLEPNISLNAFRAVWFWAQLNLLPCKLRKLANLARAFMKKNP